MKFQLHYIAFLIVCSGACAQIPIERDIPGIYSLSNFPTDTLFVKSDNTYRHKVAIGGRIFEGIGKWKYDSTSGWATFEDFVFYNGTGKDLPPGYWITKVVGKGEDVKLIYSDENNVRFDKCKLCR